MVCTLIDQLTSLRLVKSLVSLWSVSDFYVSHALQVRERGRPLVASCIRARCGHPDSSDDSVVPSEYWCLPAAQPRCSSYSSVSLKYKTRQHYFIYFAACHVNSVRDICSAVESVSGEDARNQVMLTAEGQQMDPDRVIGSYPTGTVTSHLQTVLHEPSSPLYPPSHTAGHQANLSVFQDISNLCGPTFHPFACQTKSVSLPPSSDVVFHNGCCLAYRFWPAEAVGAPSTEALASYVSTTDSPSKSKTCRLYCCYICPTPPPHSPPSLLTLPPPPFSLSPLLTLPPSHSLPPPPPTHTAAWRVCLRSWISKCANSM